MELNTDIWNNERVTRLTGQSMDDIKRCLYDLSIFISTNLHPNRLESFDIEAIMKLENYSDASNSFMLDDMKASSKMKGRSSMKVRSSSKMNTKSPLTPYKLTKSSSLDERDESSLNMIHVSATASLRRRSTAGT